MKKVALFGVQILVLSIALVQPALVHAAGMISITPKRIVFSQRDRSAEVTLFNQGDTAQTYRMSFKEMTMDKHGKLVNLEAGVVPVSASSPLLRFSPRQVRIPPGGSQTVRMMLRKPADLAVGEYRSHAQFIGLPNGSDNDVESVQLEEGTVNVSMHAQYGISIPIIVHHGDGSATAEMSNLRLFERSAQIPRPHARVTLQREGDHSLHGDILLVHNASDGKSYLVGKILGVSLYTTITRREVTIPLEVSPSQLRGGTVEARFTSDKRSGDAAAQTELTLN